MRARQVSPKKSQNGAFSGAFGPGKGTILRFSNKMPYFSEINAQKNAPKESPQTCTIAKKAPISAFRRIIGLFSQFFGLIFRKCPLEHENIGQKVDFIFCAFWNPEVSRNTCFFEYQHISMNCRGCRLNYWMCGKLGGIF